MAADNSEISVDQQEFIDSIKRLSAAELADVMRGIDPSVLIACQPKVISLYQQVDRFFGAGIGMAKDPKVLDADAVVVALLGTASFSDICKLKRIPMPFWAPVSDFFAQHQPDWMSEALELLLHPDDVLSLEPLWRDGHFKAPSCDALVHAYFDVRQSEKLDEAVLLEGLVWRFFETEGIGSHNISKHDKAAKRNQKLGYKAQATTWAERLLEYGRVGKLERSRLLSSSLVAVQCMERTSDIRWFADFHRSLEPNAAEIDKNQDVYNALVCTGHAARVSLGREFSQAE